MYGEIGLRAEASMTNDQAAGEASESAERRTIIWD
jgi:hypothetical protein